MRKWILGLLFLTGSAGASTVPQTYFQNIQVQNTSTLGTVNESGLLTITRDNSQLSLVPATSTASAIVTFTNNGDSAKIGANSSAGNAMTGGTAYSLFMYPPVNRPIEFGYSGGAGLAMRIGDNGDAGNQVYIAGTVGIGTTSPSQKLEVNGSVAATSFLGPANSAVTIATTALSTNASYYPLFVPSTSNGNQVASLSTGISVNPNTNTITATTFSGALSGNASTATSATNSTNATNTGITDDTTTNATMYPTWVTTTTGNLPQKVSSTKLTFNPSTGSLSSTSFLGTFISSSSNSASAGKIQLATNDEIRWRSADNSTDYTFKKDGSNNLSYGGAAFLSGSGILLAAAVPTFAGGDITSTGGTLTLTVAKIAGTTVSGTTGSTNVMFSTSPTMTGTALFSAMTGSGLLTLTRDNAQIQLSPATNTTVAQIAMGNNGGSTTFGLNGSSAGTMITGGTAYAFDIAPANNHVLEIGTGGGAAVAIRVGVDGANTNQVAITALAGTGSRPVLADANGVLSAPVSDSRLKLNVVSLSASLDATALVRQLRGVLFNWDTSNSRVAGFGKQQEIGLIAQEVEKVVPQVVYQNIDGYRTVTYEKLVPVLIETVKALDLRIQALEKKPK